MPPAPILIVGAGPTGLVLAIELARRDVAFHLVDRHPAPLPWDRATIVKSRTLEIFASQGLAEQFLERGKKVHGVTLFSDATPVATVRFAGLDSPFPFMLSIPENYTEAILTDTLAELGGSVERGVEFAGLTQGPEGVRARLRRNDGTERDVTASWVVGTDGLHSAVRAAIGDSFDGHEYELPWGVIDGHLSGWGHPPDLAAIQVQPPCMNPIPLKDGRWRIYFRLEREADDVMASLNRRLDEISPGAALADPDEPQQFTTHARLAHSFRIGRVLLAGDAAHAFTPLEGHGMNLGVHDGQNLGWKLALVARGEAPESLLDSYEAERRPVAEAIVRSGDEAEARGAQRDSAATQELIAFLSDEANHPEARIVEGEIGLGYPDSPIVAQVLADGQPAPAGTEIGFRVGDAGPLVSGNGTFRLHELIAGTEQCLLVLLGDADHAAVELALELARAAVQSAGRHLKAYVVTRNEAGASSAILRDPSGTVHERLGADKPSLCVVRPDGHLGFRAAPPSLDALQAHLSRILL
ncbi:MAG: FAD-dependent monooxygenase [Pseudomonadota bacterium]